MPSKANNTILLVEDDENDRFFMEHTFKEMGLVERVRFLKGGIEAIAYLIGEGKYSDREKYPRPSLVLTDLNMPQGDGFQILSHIKNSPELAAVPVVILTSSTDQDDIRAAYRLGASAYHFKPMCIKDLGVLLREIHSYWQRSEFPNIETTEKLNETRYLDKMDKRHKLFDSSYEPQTRSQS